MKPTTGTVNYTFDKAASREPTFAYLPSNPAILSGSLEENVSFSNNLALDELTRIKTILEEVGLLKTFSKMSGVLIQTLGNLVLVSRLVKNKG